MSVRVFQLVPKGFKCFPQVFLCFLLGSHGVNSYDITFLHTNDVHARIEQLNKYGGQCSMENAAEGKCYGGFARLKTKIKEIRARDANSLLLDGGDQYSGTLWFYKFGGQGIGTFMNHLGYDAVAIGNHEFDKGPEGVIPLLDSANFTVMSANIDIHPESVLTGRVERSKIFTVGGERVGVIGYTTLETPDISQSGPYLSFRDEVEVLQAEVEVLEQKGVNKIVALGHSGFEVDKKIAANVRGIDVVIGGHDNTFLYTGEPPSNDDPEGEYPHVVTQDNGAKVLCVQDYAYGKYLGNLRVTFDENGYVTSWSGNPILLDKSIERDPRTMAFLAPYGELLKNETYTVIGKSHVFLSGNKPDCRLTECNLGNLMADSLVKQNIRESDGLYWSDVSIALVNSGGIRASIEKGDITLGQCGTVMPFSNTVDIVELYGRHLRLVLEHSVSEITEPDAVKFGGFLQVSGLKIEYDRYRPVGSRVKRARALCTKCEIPVYEDIRDDEIYKIITFSFLANGGDFYSSIRDNKIKHHLIGDLDLDIFVEYLSQYSPIIQGEEERITFTSTEPCVWPSGSSTVSLSLVLIITSLMHMLV